MTTIIYTPEEIIRFKKELKDLVEKQPISYGKIIKSVKYKYLFDFINYQTSLLQDPFYRISTKVYWVIHDLIDFPVCKHCGKQLENKNCQVSSGYLESCSVKCSSNSTGFKEKSKQTCLEKYGVEHTLQRTDIRDKIKETCLEKYGVENPFQAECCKAKIKLTNIERFGVENPNQNKILEIKLP